MAKYRVLVLDDETYRHDTFQDTLSTLRGKTCTIDHCWTVDGALESLAKYNYDIVCLDHDLGKTDPNNDGTIFMSKWEQGLLDGTIKKKVKNIIIHSWNIPAAQGMASAALRLPFKKGIPIIRMAFGVELVIYLSDILECGAF